MTARLSAAHPLSSGCPPEWAAGWGQDRCGPWVTLRLGDVEPRLRWIPPVGAAGGSWLSEAPCSPALWSAVMGADQPFDATRHEAFFARAARLVPGLSLALPSAAEWDAACRAELPVPFTPPTSGAEPCREHPPRTADVPFRFRVSGAVPPPEAAVPRPARQYWLDLRLVESPPVLAAGPPERTIVTDSDEYTLRRFTRPTWASAIGRDRFGLWAEFTLDTVVQRLRWISPGWFRFGSPLDEPGRGEGEFEPQDVLIEDGFWLFDTPCTQALWMGVVKGKNPSNFRSPTRPVEQVSWDDCQRFIERLNARLPDFIAGLPTEQQWEYACRAGTTTATYAGPIEILGDNNAPILDSIAWYGGNSGVGFELGEGADASWWPNKQHAFHRAGTHPVGQKSPNPWGLYDMLGNVYEWCADDAAGSRRVVRGGSWYALARDVRAAYRSWFAPAYAGVNLGFRCRVQAGTGESGGKGDGGTGRRGGTPVNPTLTAGGSIFQDG